MCAEECHSNQHDLVTTVVWERTLRCQINVPRQHFVLILCQVNILLSRHNVAAFFIFLTYQEAETKAANEGVLRNTVNDRLSAAALIKVFRFLGAALIRLRRLFD